MNMDIAKDHFLKSILYLLRETFEGSPEGEASAYLDRGTGIFSTIENLSAGDVSRSINSTTIVAQVEHAKFYLDRLAEFMGGRTGKVNWEDSWLIETVNETEWETLRTRLRESYENVLQTFARVEDWNEDKIGEAIAIIAHTAYHLGAIRQMMKSLTTESVKSFQTEEAIGNP